jgi:hypothetical protein
VLGHIWSAMLRDPGLGRRGRIALAAALAVLLALPVYYAWVDGKEVEVDRANLAFKAAFVPAGRHAVRFEYRPTPIVVTGLLFVAMGFAGAALGVWALASRPRPPRFGRRA